MLGPLTNLDDPIVDLTYDRQRDQLFALSGPMTFFDVDIRDGSLTSVLNGGEIGIQTHGVFGLALDANALPAIHILAGGFGGPYPAIVSFPNRTGPELFATEVGGGGQIAINHIGDYFITVPDSGEVRRFSPFGVDLGTFADGLSSPADLVFDNDGNLYVSELSTGAVKYFDPTGIALGTFATGLGRPTHLAFDSNGVLFVVDEQTETIERFSSSGDALGPFGVGNGPIALGRDTLRAGDANEDLAFDQTDLVQVQIGDKYLTEQAATWGEGDWNGAPGGSPGSPPPGDGLFDQADIIAALSAGTYLTGPYAALAPGGSEDDEQTSLVYNKSTGELSVDAPASVELTSIFVTSAGNRFIGDKPAVLDGRFASFGADNVFKSTVGGSFGDSSFGNVLPTGLSEAEIAADLSASGSLSGDGGLGEVDLVYVPEPASVVLLTLGIAFGLIRLRRSSRPAQFE